jgi:hypothetical protein
MARSVAEERIAVICRPPPAGYALDGLVRHRMIRPAICRAQDTGCGS